MHKPIVISGRLALVALFFGLVLVQALYLPREAAQSAVLYPEVAFLRWPLLVLCIAMLACAQAVVVAGWQLLTLASEGRVPSGSAVRRVDAMIAAVLAACALLLAFFLYTYVCAGVHSPGFLFPPAFLFLLGLAVAVSLATVRSRLAVRT